jgi:hypothetical protein
MTGPNGHAQDNRAPTSVALPTASFMPALPQFSPEVVAALEVPFNASQIEWADSHLAFCADGPIGGCLA